MPITEVSSDDICLVLPSGMQMSSEGRILPRSGVVDHFKRLSFRHRKSASFGWQTEGKRATPSQQLAGLAEGGERLLRCEVWSWGSGRRGQLGQGDMLARPTPTVIAKLAGRGIMKVVAGNSHALALTSSGQV